MSFYYGALDQHLTISSSAFKCEGGGQRFESNKVLMHILLYDRAFIDRVTFHCWGFVFLDLPSEHYCSMPILTLSRIDIYYSLGLV